MRAQIVVLKTIANQHAEDKDARHLSRQIHEIGPDLEEIAEQIGRVTTLKPCCA